MTIEYADSALAALETVEAFILARFTEREVAAMRGLLDQFAERVEVSPTLYAKLPRHPGVHKAVLHFRLVIVYQIVAPDHIIVIDAWDTRQDR